MWQKIKSWVKRNIALVFTISFAVISLVLWLMSVDEIDFSDLWLNLLAGFIASICTITVIDSTLKKQKEKEEEPFQFALYRDVQLFTSRFISIWQEMYIQSNVERSALLIEEFFTPEKIDLIYNNLDLEGEPNVIPKQTWFNYINKEVEDLISRGNKILDRYVSFAEPELFQALHHLINDSSFVAHLLLIKKMKNFDNISNIPRPTLMSCYAFPPNEKDYKCVKILFDWCRNYYKKLRNKGKVYEIPQYISVINKQSAPTSIMSEKKMNYQNEMFEQWRKEQTII